MMYSDHDIRQALEKGSISIDPLVPEHISSSTVDLTLHSTFLVFRTTHMTHIDVREPFDVTQKVQADADGGFVIHPGEFLLGSTAERITLSNEVAGILEGRSSLGRIGLIVHATASMTKPGFSGYLTLEMSNISNLPIKLYAGMRIAQFAFLELKSPATNPYSNASKYQHQDTPAASKIWLDFDPHSRVSREK